MNLVAGIPLCRTSQKCSHLHSTHLLFQELRYSYSPVAETGNLAFRSTHELEKVRHRILLEQCLLSKARYVVKWKSGIRSEINGCFSTSLALERQNEVKKYRTFPFTIVAPKSTDMSHILHHLKTCVTQV